MRTMSNLFLALILAVVACRSVPRDVADAHQLAKTEGEAAMIVADELVSDIEAEVETLSDQTTFAAFKEWSNHRNKTLLARAVVLDYLESEEPDLVKAHLIGNRLLNDMNRGMDLIVKHWREMIDDARAADKVKFVELFRKDIARFRELERKFDEWISQFRVKG